MRRSIACLWFLAAGCSAAPTAPVVAEIGEGGVNSPQSGTAPRSETAPQDAVAPVAASVSPEQTGETAPPQPPELLFADAPFPPVDPGPVFARTAHEGDGKWGSFFADDTPEKRSLRLSSWATQYFSGERLQQLAGATDAYVRRIVLHPHSASRYQSLTVAAFDLRRLSAHHAPGRQDVLDVNHQELEKQAGRVATEDVSSLLAVFNGGFQPRHGRWGMYSLGIELVMPRKDACTVAVLKDGTVRIASWPALLDILDEIVAYRQTPPCLLENGDVHPALQRGDLKPWAGQQADRKTRRRSVVGLSADGRTLFFGVGSETEASELAAGMRHLGASAAAQLDINWNWTRLFLFAHEASDTSSAASDTEVLGSLIEQMAKDRGEYVNRASNRGFFYLTKR